MIRHSLFVAPLLLFLLLSVICQAKSLTRRFVVELEQHAGFTNQNFSTKRDRHTWPGTPSSDTVDSNSYAETDSPSDDKAQKPEGSGGKTPLVESISWQLLYATHRLVVYELIPITKETPRSLPYSWLPLDVVISVGWFLKSYWNPGPPLLNPIEQQESSHDHPLAAITIMFGSGHDQHQYQPSESPDQQAPAATSRPQASFTAPQNTDYGGGNPDPHQHSHTLGFNCFFHPCRGVCQFRLLSGCKELAESTLNSENMSTAGNGSSSDLADGYHLSNTDHFDLLNMTPSQNKSSFKVLNNHPDTQISFDSYQLFEPQMRGIDVNPANSFNPINRVGFDGTGFDGIDLDGIELDGIDFDWASIDSLSTGAAYTNATKEPVNDHLAIPETGYLAPEGAKYWQQALSEPNNKHYSRQLICDVIVTRDGQPRPCGIICKNATSLSAHKSRAHTGQQTCNLTVIREDGQPQPCGVVCKNAASLSVHKSKVHTGQKICDVTVVGKDGQLRPCKTVCKHAQDLSNHKNRYHSGQQQTCDAIVTGKDGQLQPCGKVCKHSRSLLAHIRRNHNRQKTCDETIVGEDGQPQPCGTVCKSALALSEHKKRNHSGQQTCDAIVVGVDGLLRPCGKICKSFRVLSNHKIGEHSGQKSCEVAVVGEDGQLRPCGKICKNSKVLSDHKIGYHSGQKSCELAMVGEDGQLRACGKVCKNARALLDHKRIHHTGQQSCKVSVIGDDGLLRPCGEICKNAKYLSYHKRKEHTGQQICYIRVVGKDGQMQPCGRVSKNAQALSQHKRRHRKRKQIGVTPGDECSNPAGKVHK
ncbi:hypothetical protein [Endozoicomonas sp. ISHI1]|uniref:hypothetical protein n=1 Tax=Endozoicomonas sp. ISHI1 TaxID=2825882 RepID=UPI002148EDD3|nr:hypothetical protein [Endozoicomonas sp. ISHI1]